MLKALASDDTCYEFEPFPFMNSMYNEILDTSGNCTQIVFPMTVDARLVSQYIAYIGNKDDKANILSITIPKHAVCGIVDF